MNKFIKIIALICLNIMSLVYLDIVLADNVLKESDYYVYELSVNNNPSITLQINKSESNFYYENIAVDKKCEEKNINDVANLNIGFKKSTKVMLKPVQENDGILKMIIGVSQSQPRNDFDIVRLNADCTLVNAQIERQPFITVEEFKINKPVNLSIQDGNTLKLVRVK